MLFQECYDNMNDIPETGDEDNMQVPEQINRILEYEKKLSRDESKPTFAAMFLVHFLVSLSLISLITYWYFI